MYPPLAAACDEFLADAEAAKATSSGFGSLGCAMWIVSPMRPNSQPTPTAPGPLRVPVFRQQSSVGEFKPRVAISLGRKAYLYPADVPAELPCKGEMR